MQAANIAANVAPTGPSQSAGVGGLLAEAGGKAADDQTAGQAAGADAANPFAEALAAAMGVIQPVAIQATPPTTAPSTADTGAAQANGGAAAARFELAALANPVPGAAEVVAGADQSPTGQADQTAKGQSPLADDMIATPGQAAQPQVKVAEPKAAAPAMPAQSALASGQSAPQAPTPPAPTPPAVDAAAIAVASATTAAQTETAPPDQAQGFAEAAAQAAVVRLQDRNQARADAKAAKADAKAAPIDAASTDQPTAKAAATASLVSAADENAKTGPLSGDKTGERPSDDSQVVKADDRSGQSPPQILAADIRTQANTLQTEARVAAHTVAHLAAQIVDKVAGKSTRFDVQLDPAGLGRVDVKIEIGARGELTAALSFDNPQAAAELRGRAGELQRALEQAGFDLSKGGLSFDMSGQGNGQNLFEQQADNRPTWRGRAFTDLSAIADAPPPILSRSAQAGGVDVTV